MGLFDAQYKQDFVLVNQATQPVELGSVKVENGQDFNREYLGGLLKPLLSTNLYTVGTLSSSIASVEENFSLTGDPVLQSAKVVVNKDINGTANVEIGLPTAQQITNKLKLTTSTNELGGGIGLGYLNGNVYGNGEKLAIAAGVDQSLANHFANLSFAVPVKNAPSSQLFFNGGSNGTNGELNRQVTMGLNTSRLLLSKKYFYSSFGGISITQNKVDGEEFSGKGSLVGNVEVSNLQTVSAVQFPVSGTQTQISGEVSKILANDGRNFWKVLMNSNSFYSFCNKSVTFNSSSTIGHVHNLNDSTGLHPSDKLSYDCLTPGLLPASHISLSSGHEKIEGSFIGSHAFRVFTKVPIFHQYFADRESVLRLQLFLRSATVADSLSEFKSHKLSCDTLKGCLQGTVNVRQLFDEHSSHVGAGLFFRSQFASVDMGYSLPLGDAKLGPVVKPGFHFNASVSFN
ncbi:hypothetical protein DASC09_015480 [Saccharomycopsis crataegensis]|uniref:Bacterial surface antigen (D15) domain-containing protein n=1 Tax=Saccharomycopsis crataegensis TaxID=43959 RepID=A0AAV5QHH4_9ASCO|nr:hypothetical protein DASC09_015480 [Saccharomycopsis crataegensis]